MRLRSDAHQEMPGQEPPGQRAFISHSWKDKALARRIGRRLGHRGACIWIDEAEMQLGDRLSQRLADEIRGIQPSGGRADGRRRRVAMGRAGDRCRT
jgi:hypothetical protein